MSRSTKKDPTDEKKPEKRGLMIKRTLTTISLAIVLGLAILLATGCQNGIIQINPSTDVDRYEALGKDIGGYMKIYEPKAVADAADWVKGALLMSDEELLSKDALQVMYEYILERASHPEVVLLAKSTLSVFGVKVNLNAGQLLPDEKPVYLKCVRGLLKGYSKATK